MWYNPSKGLCGLRPRIERHNCTFGAAEGFVPSRTPTSYQKGTRPPRSYSHPTQPILQLRSHYLLKIRLRLLYNHTHLLTYEQAPSERECDYMIDRIYLFQQNMLTLLAYVRIFLYLCRLFN